MTKSIPQALNQAINSILKPLLSCVLVLLLTTACVTTGLATAPSSPWVPVPLDISSNPLDVAFTDSQHGFLVGSNRLVMETNDGGNSWADWTDLSNSYAGFATTASPSLAFFFFAIFCFGGATVATLPGAYL